MYLAVDAVHIHVSSLVHLTQRRTHHGGLFGQIHQLVLGHQLVRVKACGAVSAQVRLAVSAESCGSLLLCLQYDQRYIQWQTNDDLQQKYHKQRLVPQFLQCVPP